MRCCPARSAGDGVEKVDQRAVPREALAVLAVVGARCDEAGAVEGFVVRTLPWLVAPGPRALGGDAGRRCRRTANFAREASLIQSLGLSGIAIARAFPSGRPGRARPTGRSPAGGSRRCRGRRRRSTGEIERCSGPCPFDVGDVRDDPPFAVRWIVVS